MNEYNEVYFRASAWNKVEENGKIWMALKNRNGICEVDKKSQCARIIKIFEDESLADEDLYTHIEKVGSNLIFTPGMAKRIAIYNLENNSLSYISLKRLKRCYKESQDEIKFWNTFQYQSDIYMFGYSYPAIIKIDTKSMEAVYITDWVDIVEKNIKVGNRDGYFSDGHVICKGQALIPFGCTNAVLELNLTNTNIKIKKLKVSMKCIGGISSIDGENIWMVGRGSAVNDGDNVWIEKNDGITNVISCWNRKADIIKEILLIDIDKNMYDPFYAPICMDSKIFLLPISASCVYEINAHTGEVKKNQVLERAFEDVNGQLFPWWKTIASESNENQLSFLTCNDSRWHEYDVITGKLQRFFYHIQEDLSDTEEYFEAIYNDSKNIISESKFPLEYFTKKVLDSNNEDESNNATYSVGENIYRKINRYL